MYWLNQQACGAASPGWLLRVLPGGGSFWDETFQPPRFPAYDGTRVNTVIPQPDGKILVGGDWGIGLVRLNSDGSEDTTFQPPLDSGSAMSLQADGQILIGGWFSSVNQIPAEAHGADHPESSNATVAPAGGT